MPNPEDDFEDLFKLDDEPVEAPAPKAAPKTTRAKAAPAKAAPKAAAKSAAKPAEPEMTPEQKRIAELEALVAAPMPDFEDAAPSDEPSPDQLRIKALEDQLAKRNATIMENAPAQYDTTEGEAIHIHFLEDGFVALGQVWYRGQEVEIVKGSPAYNRTLDRNGDTWINLAFDVPEQQRRWGLQKLGIGPFVPRKGERFDDDVATEDARRGRAAPLSFI